MRKVVIPRAGVTEQLTLETRPEPSPAPQEVVVTTEAIGVNYADCVIRMGLYASAKEYVGWPITPGLEFVGTVSAVGSAITDLAPGARVFDVTRFGGYSTHVAVPRHQVFSLPTRFDMAQAAGFPSVFLTAYYALFELAHPRPGRGGARPQGLYVAGGPEAGLEGTDRPTGQSRFRWAPGHRSLAMGREVRRVAHGGFGALAWAPPSRSPAWRSADGPQQHPCYAGGVPWNTVGPDLPYSEGR